MINFYHCVTSNELRELAKNDKLSPGDIFTLDGVIYTVFDVSVEMREGRILEKHYTFLPTDSGGRELQLTTCDDITDAPTETPDEAWLELLEE